MKPLILAMLPLVCILLVSGCTGSTTGGFTEGLAGNGGDTQLVDDGSFPAQAAQGADPVLDVASVKTDKDIYHSAEVMKIMAVVNAQEAVPGAVVTATGVNGKMSLSQTLDLSAGGNEVQFQYQLPRCNVCGGIREGNYTCTLSASRGSSSSSQDFVVEIMQ